jgi:predicted HD phosphohydrolase
MEEAGRQVSYTAMKHGTKEDYELVFSAWDDEDDGTADWCLRLLDEQHSHTGVEKITRRQHSLQAGTRAMRDDAADEELVVVALLHDIGDVLSLHNHSEVGAAILRPFVSDESYWVLKHHGIFQKYYYAHHIGGDRYEREQFRDHPYYAATVRFCEKYDQCSFDPDYDTLPIEAFEPIVRKVMTKRREQLV